MTEQTPNEMQTRSRDQMQGQTWDCCPDRNRAQAPEPLQPCAPARGPTQTAEEKQLYLEQALYLDQSINSKLRQLDRLNDLVRECTGVVTGMPRAASPAASGLEETLAKLVDLQAEINSDIDRLVDLKRELRGVILTLKEPEYRIVLELRYLCFLGWDEIAAQMSYSRAQVFRILRKAIDAVVLPGMPV